MDVSTKGDAELAAIISQLREDEEAIRLLARRKKSELRLVRKFDKPRIETSSECWFMVDAAWLNHWSEFVNDLDCEEPPGPLSTRNLLCDATSIPSAGDVFRDRQREREKEREREKGRDKDKGKGSDNEKDNNKDKEENRSSFSSRSGSLSHSQSLSDSSGVEHLEGEGNKTSGPVFTKGPGLKVPLPGLQPRIDYRAVPPIVYFIFVELYGRDSAPDICRYSVDIYKPEVPVDQLVHIKLKAVMDAKVQVNRVRPKWMKWERKYDEDEEDKGTCCCGLTKEHLEAFIFWAIRCWSRKSSGREKINYSQYKPLSDTTEMDNSVRNMQSGHGSDSNRDSTGWWPTNWGGDIDSSSHSNKSSGSSHGGITELTTTRNQLHAGGTSKKSKIPSKKLPDDFDEDFDDLEFDSESEEEIEFGVAPADRDYERGTWLRNAVSSHGAN